MADDKTKQLEAAQKTLEGLKSISDEAAQNFQLLIDKFESGAITAKELADAQGQANQRIREFGDAARSLERSAERLIRSLTGVEQQADGVAAGFGRMLAEGKSFNDALKAMGKTVAKTMTPMNVGISIFKKFSEASVVLTMEIDNASSAFAKATGTGNKYKDVIKAAEFQNRRYGVSASESAAATSTLIGGFSEFLMIDGDLQKALVGEIAGFEKFGVAAGTSVKFLENVTRTTGRSIPAAQRLQKSIMGTANAFGDDLNKVMEESAEIMPKLAIHGQKLEGVLDNLYSASKRTGMGMSEIVSFAEQFDTFDSAAQAAGNLNAVLGQMGGAPLVDTMQILEETDPAKRMQLFSDAIQQSVGDFEQLGYYQQKAIANTMGMSVEETRRILLQEEETNKLNTAMQRAGLSQEKILELQAEGRDLMTEMKILAMQFAVNLEAPMTVLKDMIGRINNFMGGVGPMHKVVGVLAAVGTLGGIGAVMGRLALRGTRVLPMHVIMGQGFLTQLKGLGRFNPFSAKFGQTAGMAASTGVSSATTPGVMQVGKNVAKLAAPIALAAGGIWAASKAFDRLAGEKDKKKRAGRKVGMSLGAVLGGIGLFAAAGALGATGVGIPAAAALLGAGAGAYGLGEVGGAVMADGGIVTKPTLSMTGEKGPEAVVPLNAQGREGIGMTDNNKLLEANNRKLDELIAAVSNQRPVLIKSDLERAGFINKAAKVTG